MKIATCNVNSMNVCLPHVFEGKDRKFFRDITGRRTKFTNYGKKLVHRLALPDIIYDTVPAFGQPDAFMMADADRRDN